MLKRYTKFLPLLLSFSTPFTIYLLTLAPTYIFDDSAELSLCVKYLGVCHPPGFPLYILVSRLLSLLIPISDLQYKMNLLSAIYSSASILVIFLTLNFKIKQKWLSLVLCLLLAFTTPYWELALGTEVFAFGTLITSLMLYFVILKKTYTSFLFLGFLTSLLYFPIVLFPALIWYYWRLKVNFKKYVLALIWFGSGLSILLLVYFRALSNPIINWGHISSINDYLKYLIRYEFGGVFLIHQEAQPISVYYFFLQIIYFHLQLIKDFLFLAVIPFIYVFLKRKRLDRLDILLGSIYVGLVLTVAGILSTCNSFQTPDIHFNKFYLLPYLFFLFLIGKFCWEFVYKKYGRYSVIGLGAFVLLITVFKYPKMDMSKNTFSKEFTYDVLKSLSNDAVAMTVNHPFYFQARYEQLENNKYPNLILIYHPNIKNHDSYNYNPQIFADSLENIFNTTDMLTVFENLVDSIKGHTVYIQRGQFEDILCSGYKDRLYPIGMWYQYEQRPSGNKIIPDFIDNWSFKGYPTYILTASQSNFIKKYTTYALYTTAIDLASNGEYDLAIKYFTAATKYSNGNIDTEVDIQLIREVQNEFPQWKDMLRNKNKMRLSRLITNLNTIKNYNDGILILEEEIKVFPDDARLYSNLGSFYALNGEKVKAVTIYKKALKIDPNLTNALNGLKNLELENDK